MHNQNKNGLRLYQRTQNKILQYSLRLKLWASIPIPDPPYYESPAAGRYMYVVSKMRNNLMSGTALPTNLPPTVHASKTVFQNTALTQKHAFLH
jgi:hypothetical protein